MARRHGAFTLLEVLIATGILGGALVALFCTVRQATRMQTRAIALMRMSSAGRNVMTRLLARRDLKDGLRDEGRVKGSGIDWSLEVSRVELPFLNTDIVKKHSNLLQVKLVLRSEDLDRPFEMIEYVKRGRP